MPRFIIQHITKYNYAEPVIDSANQIMLYPLKDEYQEVQNQQIVITGEPTVEIYKDYYENEIGTFMNAAAHMELKIDSTIAVVTKPKIFPQDEQETTLQWKQIKELSTMGQFLDFLMQENFKHLPDVKKIADEGFYQTVSVYTAVKQLTEYVYTNFKYIKGITTVETTLDEIWDLKAGVCQDFAHILLVMLRLLCVPARYVSGYVCPQDNTLRGEGATHAWVEAYIPFYGWLGVDPTNNCIVNDLHVRLAIGRKFSDCSPVKGTYKGTAKQSLEVGVSVRHEDGSLTKDYATLLQPQDAPASFITNDDDGNSFRRYMQMVQQQQ